MPVATSQFVDALKTLVGNSDYVLLIATNPKAEQKLALRLLATRVDLLQLSNTQSTTYSLDFERHCLLVDEKERGQDFLFHFLSRFRDCLQAVRENRAYMFRKDPSPSHDINSDESEQHLFDDLLDQSQKESVTKQIRVLSKAEIESLYGGVNIGFVMANQMHNTVRKLDKKQQENIIGFMVEHQFISRKALPHLKHVGLSSQLNRTLSNVFRDLKNGKLQLTVDGNVQIKSGVFKKQRTDIGPTLNFEHFETDAYTHLNAFIRGNDDAGSALQESLESLEKIAAKDAQYLTRYETLLSRIKNSKRLHHLNRLMGRFDTYAPDHKSREGIKVGIETCYKFKSQLQSLPLEKLKAEDIQHVSKRSHAIDLKLEHQIMSLRTDLENLHENHLYTHNKQALHQLVSNPSAQEKIWKDEGLDARQIQSLLTTARRLAFLDSHLSSSHFQITTDTSTPDKKALLNLFNSAAVIENDESSTAWLKKMGEVIASAAPSKRIRFAHDIIHDVCHADFATMVMIAEHEAQTQVGKNSGKYALDDTLRHIGTRILSQDPAKQDQFNMKACLREAKLALSTMIDTGLRGFRDLIFDKNTIAAVMKSDIGKESLAACNLLFAHCIILQYQVQNPDNFDQDSVKALLETCHIDMDIDDIRQAASQGFIGSSKLETATTFIREMARSIAQHSEVKKVLTLAMAKHPKVLATTVQRNIVADKDHVGGMNDAQINALSTKTTEKIGKTDPGSPAIPTGITVKGKTLISETVRQKLRDALKKDAYLLADLLSDINLANSKIRLNRHRQRKLETQMSELEDKKARLKSRQIKANQALAAANIKMGATSNQIVRNVLEIEDDQMAVKMASPPPKEGPLIALTLDLRNEIVATRQDMIHLNFSGTRQKGKRLTAVNADGIILDRKTMKTETCYLAIIEQTEFTEPGQSAAIYGYIDPKDPLLSTYDAYLESLLTGSASNAWKNALKGYKSDTLYRSQKIGKKAATLITLNQADRTLVYHLAAKKDADTLLETHDKASISYKDRMAKIEKELQASEKAFNDAINKGKQNLEPIFSGLKYALAKTIMTADDADGLSDLIDSLQSHANRDQLYNHLANIGLSVSDIKSDHLLGSGHPLDALIDDILRQFDGIDTLKDWIADIKLEEQLLDTMAKAEAQHVTLTSATKTEHDSLALKSARTWIAQLKDGDGFDVHWGDTRRIHIPDATEQLKSVLRNGTIATGLPAEGSHNELFRVTKTAMASNVESFDIYLNKEATAKLGIALEAFGSMISGNSSGKTGKNWGYRLRFNSKEKVSIFLAHIMTGQTPDQTLGLPELVFYQGGYSGSIGLNTTLKSPINDLIPGDESDIDGPFGLQASLVASHQQISSQNIRQHEADSMQEYRFHTEMHAGALGSLFKNTIKMTSRNREKLARVSDDTFSHIDLRFMQKRHLAIEGSMLKSATTQKGYVIDPGALSVLLEEGSNPILIAQTLLLPDEEVERISKNQPTIRDALNNLIKTSKPGDYLVLESTLKPLAKLQISEFLDPTHINYNPKRAKKWLGDNSNYTPQALKRCRQPANTKTEVVGSLGMAKWESVLTSDTTETERVLLRS